MKAIRLRGLVKTLRKSTEELQILLADTHTDIVDMQHEYSLWVASFEELLTVNEDSCALLSPTSRDQHLLDFDPKKQQFLAVKVLMEDWFASKQLRRHYGQHNNNRDIDAASVRSKSASVMSIRLEMNKKNGIAYAYRTITEETSSSPGEITHSTRRRGSTS